MVGTYRALSRVPEHILNPLIRFLAYNSVTGFSLRSGQHSAVELHMFRVGSAAASYLGRSQAAHRGITNI